MAALLALAASATLTAGVAIALAIVAAGAQAHEGEHIRNDDGGILHGPNLQFTCSLAKVGYFDPIRNMSHEHLFFGEKAVYPKSTPQSITSNGSDTTCFASSTAEESNNSYWEPRPREGTPGRRMQVGKARGYYNDLGPGPLANLDTQFPTGLEMVATEANGDLQFNCRSDAQGRVETPPYGCRGAVRIIRHFPNCWDPPGLTPEDVAFRETCRSYETQLPDFRLATDYTPQDGVLEKPMQFSTGHHTWGHWSTGHADRMDGEGQSSEFTELMSECVLQPSQEMETRQDGQPPEQCYPHFTGEAAG